MLDNYHLNQLAEPLLVWFLDHARVLPWRERPEPYRVWVSEIMLQQTRVEAVKPYYERFLKALPDVAALAACPEDQLMKLWEGLGYYNRVRNMQKAAVTVTEEYGGVLPADYGKLLELKGIGSYTAGAIASIAYGIPVPAVDGNVLRILTRVAADDTDIMKQSFRSAGEAQLGEMMQDLTVPEELRRALRDENVPGAFNQAMMEFGALQCVPKSPDCECCPLNGKCLGLAARRVERLPVKSGKTVVKPRYFNYLYIHGQGMTLLSKRTGNDIWRNLYEFPLIETERAVTWEELSGMAVFQELFDGIEKVEITREYVAKKHVLSHRVIYPVFYEIRVDSFSESMGKYLKVPDNRVGEYAVSRLIQSYLEVRDGLLF